MMMSSLIGPTPRISVWPPPYAAEDARDDVRGHLARDLAFDVHGAAGHVLVGDVRVHVDAARRHLAAPPGLVVEAGRHAVGDLPAAPVRPDRAVRRVLAAVAGVDAAAAFSRRLRDDVHDAVEGVGAVERRAGAANDLDALDVLDGDGEIAPERRAEQVGVHAAAVEQDEHLVRQALVEAAHRDLGLRPRRLHDVDAGEAPEELGDLRDARKPDVLFGDDRGGVRGVERVLRRPGGGDDGLLEDLFGLERPRRMRALARSGRRGGRPSRDRAARERARARPARRRRPGLAGAGDCGCTCRWWCDLHLLRLQHHRLLLANALLRGSRRSARLRRGPWGRPPDISCSRRSRLRGRPCLRRREQCCRVHWGAGGCRRPTSTPRCLRRSGPPRWRPFPS